MYRNKMSNNIITRTVLLKIVDIEDNNFKTIIPENLWQYHKYVFLIL